MRNEPIPAFGELDREGRMNDDAEIVGEGSRHYSGVLKWFDMTRGFGFLVGD